MNTSHTVQSYRDLIVWKKSMQLVVLTYRLSDHFPKNELYGITMQMRRAAISIPSNIAEGFRRHTRKDYCHFLTLSYGSGAELETQLEITKRLTFIDHSAYKEIDPLMNEIMRMLNSMIQKLEQ